MTTPRFLLACAGSALAVSGLLVLPPVGDLLRGGGGLPGRVLVRALVFPGVAEGVGAGTAAGLAVFAVAVPVGAYAVFRWAGFGGARWGWPVCAALVGAPAGVLAVLVWSAVSGGGFDEHVTYAAVWGAATGVAAGAPVVLLGTPLPPEAPTGEGVPSGRRPSAPVGPAGKGRSGVGRGGFRSRAWVLPVVLLGWAAVWSVFLRDLAPLAWLPLSFDYFPQVAVVLAAVAAGTVEGTLRRWFPVEGRAARSFVLTWIALCAAPIVYAAVVAVDAGMRESLVADPASFAWASEYAEDAGAALVARPMQLALPPPLLALAVTVLRKALSGGEQARTDPEAVRPDRRWGLLPAGAALALTYFLLAVTSRFSAQARGSFERDAPVLLKGLAFLTPPGESATRGYVVWFWTIAVGFAASAAALVYVAVRGRLVRLFPASAYPALVAALALAVQLAWNGGSVVARAVTGMRPLGTPLAAQAAAFTAFVAPIFAAVLFLAHLQVGLARFVDSIDAEEDGSKAWAKVAARGREWRERARAHLPERRARALLAARAAGAGLVVAVVAGTFQAFGAGSPAGRAAVPAGETFVVLPGLSVAGASLENLTAASWIVLLGGLVYLVAGRVEVEGEGLAAGLTVWGLSVTAGGPAVLPRALLEAAGGPFGPGDFLEVYAGTGLQMGFVAGPFVILGVLTAVPRRVLPYGAAALAVVALAPTVRPATGGGPVTVGPGLWHEERAAPRTTIEVAHPVARGPGADRIDDALLAPVRALVAATPDATRVTASYAVTRHDADVLSVRYLTRWYGPHPGERAQTATYDLRTGRPLGVRDLFTPAALSRAGRERLAATLRPLLPPGAVANPSLLRVDGDFAEVGLAPGAVEFTYGRGLLCPDCPAVTVRVPEERLAGLLRPWR